MMYDDDHVEAEFQAKLTFAWYSIWVALACALVAAGYALATI